MMFRFSALVLVAAALSAQDAAPRPVWRLVWQDEFNLTEGMPPDPAKWTYDTGQTGWGNEELENYTSSPQNAFHDGQGHLVIQAVAQPGPNYTSARLKTQGLAAFTYGRVEARIRIPYGQGLWPAFWMLGANIGAVGWPRCGEIDIMENIGREPGMVHGTIHGPGYSGSGGIGAAYALASGRFADDFHVFSVDWAPRSLTLSVDGTPYKRITARDLPAGTTWVYDHPFFLLLNVAVGGTWPGNPDASTQFPQRMLVDYVRVYFRGPGGPVPDR